MSLHIGELTADVTVLAGEEPLTEGQLRQVTEAVLRMIAARERDQKLQQAATQISASAQPPLPVTR